MEGFSKKKFPAHLWNYVYKNKDITLNKGIQFPDNEDRA